MKEGAFLIGGLGAVFCGFFLPVQLGLSIIPIAIIFAGILGGIWLYFPGYLLAKFEVDEVVSTLMLNFIAIAITGYLINGPLLSPTSTVVFRTSFNKTGRLIEASEGIIESSLSFITKEF